MRVLILTPWDNAWVPLYKKVFVDRGHQVRVDRDGAKWQMADVFLHMWAGITKPRVNAVNIMFMRRFEFFDFDWRSYDWSNIDCLIFCNSFFKDEFDKYFDNKVPTTLIKNAVDADCWAFSDREAGKKIGMACHIHPKKNLPLAAQILMALGADYELHIAGAVQDPCTALYLTTLGEQIKLYGHVEDLDSWWEDKNYCLSTSISEGNPNNVLEAMAKGIRPVVHGWPGSEGQFPDGCTFRSVDEAVTQITGQYGNGYRDFAVEHYSPEKFNQVVNLVEHIKEVV